MRTITAEELKATLDAHVEWLHGSGDVRANLSFADLSGANLSGADLRFADLSGANLRGANLRGADLSGANLRGADLLGAYLSGANLRGADLLGAYLRDANLRDADLRDANLRDANLRGADLRGAYLRGANLGGAVLEDGVNVKEYVEKVVPGLLTAGGKTLEEVLTTGCWECHEWNNCPMAVAFNVHSVDEVPALHRWQARRFVALFDAGQIPKPELSATSAEGG